MLVLRFEQKKESILKEDDSKDDALFGKLKFRQIKCQYVYRGIPKSHLPSIFHARAIASDLYTCPGLSRMDKPFMALSKQLQQLPAISGYFQSLQKHSRKLSKHDFLLFK